MSILVLEHSYRLAVARKAERAAGSAEANTYNLPRGDRLRARVKRVFRDQHGAILRYLRTGRKDGGDPLPHDWPDWNDFQLGSLAVSQRMTPLLTLTWEDAAAAFAPRVGLDPDHWEVVNPHTERMIDEAALAFCGSMNATTSLQLDEALSKTREELRAGVVETGESVEKLTKRINAIFDGAEKWRARRIAQTETSRAVHAAQEQAAIVSGVVTGWTWLLSSDACPMCNTIARRAPAVRLGQPFAVIGDNPHYSQVKFPPAHPHCNCTVLEVLDTDEQPAFSDTLHQPKPEAEDVVLPNVTPLSPRPAPLTAAAAARGSEEGTAGGHAEAAIARATKIAGRAGLDVASREDSDRLLFERFNPAELKHVIAFYDETGDELAINHGHRAWQDLRAYMRDPVRKGYFSSRLADHLVHHEIGHARHYRGMSPAERADIWLKKLTAEELPVAEKVGKYAMEGRVEFVAEVYAGRRAGRKFPADVLALYEQLKGPER